MMKKIVLLLLCFAFNSHCFHLNAEEDLDLKLEQEEVEQLSDFATDESTQKDFQKQVAQAGSGGG